MHYPIAAFFLFVVPVSDSFAAVAEVRLVRDSATAGGLSAYRIETALAVYVLEKSGAGLSSLYDQDGNDWLSFDPAPGSRAGGEYRGFPNAVHQQAGNYFHPKNQATDPAKTSVDYAGADRVSISILARGGLWAGRYDFFPGHCTFTMTRMPLDKRYWVLYEGTPGGQYDDSDWWIAADTKSRQRLTTPHDGDLPGPEWIAFGDEQLNRVLYLVHHQDDGYPDRFYQMDEQMTVFGFGRQGIKKYLDYVPQSVTIGFLETTNYAEVKEAMKTRHRIAQSLLLAATASLAIAGEPAWERKSSTTGDLPVPNEGNQQTCCVVADLDGDGVEEFVVGERTKTPSIVGYKLSGKKWDRFVIDDAPLKPEAGGVCFDVDGDGDQDVVFGQDASGSDIWWWENPSPKKFSKKPWNRRLIKQGGPKKHHDQTAGDFDGDGRIEFVSWNQGGKQLLIFEIPDDPRNSGVWSATPIYSWKSGRELEGFPSRPVDIDLDGKIDIVGGGRWFKHQGGTRFKAMVIDQQQRFTQCAAGQLVDGGRPEVVFSPGDMDGNAKWYQWDGKEWKDHDLGFVVHGHTCDIRDIDGDGHADVFIGEMGNPGAGNNAKTYIWYGDGRGELRKTVASRGQGIHEGILSDLDGDGDIDILMKPYNHNSPRIDILLNSPK